MITELMKNEYTMKDGKPARVPRAHNREIPFSMVDLEDLGMVERNVE
jgi:hypothetical protein